MVIFAVINQSNYSILQIVFQILHGVSSQDIETLSSRKKFFTSFLQTLVEQI